MWRAEKQNITNVCISTVNNEIMNASSTWPVEKKYSHVCQLCYSSLFWQWHCRVNLFDQAICDTASLAASESAATLRSSAKRTSNDYQSATFQTSLMLAEMSANSQWHLLFNVNIDYYYYCRILLLPSFTYLLLLPDTRYFHILPQSSRPKSDEFSYQCFMAHILCGRYNS